MRSSRQPLAPGNRQISGPLIGFTSSAGLVFVDDSRKCSQSFVDFARVREHRRHIGLQHHDRAACRITRSIFVGTSVTEIVLWQDLVLFDRSRFSLIPFS